MAERGSGDDKTPTRIVVEVAGRAAELLSSVCAESGIAPSGTAPSAIADAVKVTTTSEWTLGG